MGVLAIVAFSAFSGVLGNSKKKADFSQAENIEKAIQIYITDTGDVTLSKMCDPNGSPYNFSTSTTWGAIVSAIQNVVQCPDHTGVKRTYGPLLTNPNGASNTITASSYEPQWTQAAGGEHEGYTITIYKSSSTVRVVPYTVGTAGNPDQLKLEN